MMILDRTILPKTLIIHDPEGRVVDYTAFLKLIDYWHDWFNQHGIKAGDKIVINLLSSSSMFGLFFACLEAGVLFIGTETPNFYLLPRYKNIEFDYIFTHRNIKHLRDDEFFRNKVIRIIPNDAHKWTKKPRKTPPYKRKPSDLATLSVTSGTTSEPKLIYHTHESLYLASDRARYLYEPTDRLVMYMNINHLGLLTTSTLPVMMQGCEMLLCASAWTVGILYAIMERKVNKFQMFEWAWFRLIDVWERSIKNLNGPMLHLENPTVITGGDIISNVYLKSLFDHGVKDVHIMYGSTEAPPPIFTKYVTPDTLDTYDRHWLGDLRPGWEAKLNNDGALMVKGKSIGKGKDLNFLYNGDGWYNMNDVCEIKDGNYRFLHRTHQLKRNDVSVCTNDIFIILENVIFKPGKGQERPFHMVKLSIDDKDYMVLAVLHRSKTVEGEFPCLEKINTVIRENLDENHLIDDIMVLDDYPFTGLKIDFANLREQATKLLIEKKSAD